MKTKKWYEFWKTNSDRKKVEKETEDIISTCPGCGASISHPKKFAGQNMLCPECGNRFTLGLPARKRLILDKDRNKDQPKIKPFVDISNVYFISSDHKRYNNGKWNGSNDKGNMRAIEVKPDSEFDSSFIVTLYNLSGIHPEWGNNIQIAPKRMRIISSDKDQITLRGYGDDPMLADRPPQNQKDYGITIHLKSNDIEYVSYYYHDRNVRIDFLK